MKKKYTFEKGVLTVLADDFVAPENIRCNVKSAIIDDGVTRIGRWVFCGCRSLTSVTIPSSVESIGDGAFYKCRNLTKRGLYKATDAALKCRGYQYKIGEWHHTDKAILCKCGFHYCENAYDLFNYYSGEIGKDFRIFEVEVAGVSPEKEEDSKRVCTDIRLVRELTLSELLGQG